MFTPINTSQANYDKNITNHSYWISASIASLQWMLFASDVINNKLTNNKDPKFHDFDGDAEDQLFKWLWAWDLTKKHFVSTSNPENHCLKCFKSNNSSKNDLWYHFPQFSQKISPTHYHNNNSWTQLIIMYQLKLTLLCNLQNQSMNTPGKPSAALPTPQHLCKNQPQW